MRGVIRYHGAAAPVVSVRRHLGYPDAPPRLHTPIILVHISGYLIGLIVDEVLAVVSRLPSQIVPPEQVVPEGLGETPALQGLIHTQEEIVLLLSLERMFSPQHTQTFARLASGLSGGMNALRPDEAVQTGDAPASLALEAQGEAAA
jgi:chemotaxis signal transduction protein